ncbi:hypothetical protein [Pandoraea terrigena]|uniref:Tail fiber protein n=1 Tax=Pandoraea terrigena TaxID=2508292 RepID=A0A5E4YLM6_9BURK|nr:hypothetical protein [Pandoraea terrigena]VVE49315.1 hypothetical protein PTE31013_04624 [Pandoraea terrigena]
MSQDSLIIPTTGTLSGLSLVQDLNAALANLASCASGATDPSSLPGGVQPFSLWLDSSVVPPVLRQRNAGNTAWDGLSVTAATKPEHAISMGQADVAYAPYSSASGKNRLLNGAMYLDQENAGATVTFTAGAPIRYCLDQWYASCTGANITGSRVSAASGDYKFTGAAGNTGTLFGQRIESTSVADLAGEVVSGQIKASSSSVTSMTWNAYSANAPDNFSAKALIASGTLAIDSTATVYPFSFNAGSNAANGIAVEFVTGPLLAGQTLTYGSAQFEFGTSATSFERRNPALELVACERYFQYVVAGGYTGPTDSISVYGTATQFRVRPRAAPTITYVSDLPVSSGFIGTAPTVDSISVYGFRAYKQSNATPSQWGCVMSANARL